MVSNTSSYQVTCKAGHTLRENGTCTTTVVKPKTVRFYFSRSTFRVFHEQYLYFYRLRPLSPKQRSRQCFPKQRSLPYSQLSRPSPLLSQHLRLRLFIRHSLEQNALQASLLLLWYFKLALLIPTSSPLDSACVAAAAKASLPLNGVASCDLTSRHCAITCKSGHTLRENGTCTTTVVKTTVSFFSLSSLYL